MSAFAEIEERPRLLDAQGLQRLTLRLAHQVAERHADIGDVLLAGVRTRGAPLAVRLARALQAIAGAVPELCEIDVTAFRDDRPRSAGHDPPSVTTPNGASVRVDDRAVIIVDDVLFTGRTVRAAIDAVMAMGRPRAIEVLTLVDRGHRELPVRATYVGKNVPTAATQRVQVRLREVDGVDGAWLLRTDLA